MHRKTFYHDLYATRNSKLTNEIEKMFFDDDNPFLSRLTAEEADSCEGKLMLHECLKALKSMANEKSPGPMAILQSFISFF
jgi:hypothetical protein